MTPCSVAGSRPWRPLQRPRTDKRLRCRSTAAGGQPLQQADVAQTWKVVQLSGSFILVVGAVGTVFWNVLKPWSSVELLSKRQDEFRQDMKDGFSKMDDGFSKVDDRFSKLEKKMDDRFSSLLKKMDDGFNRLDNKKLDRSHLYTVVGAVALFALTKRT